MIPSEEEVNRERVKRSQLINRVAHKKVLLNRTIGINTQLTHDINSMRREIMFANTAIATMKANIAECKAVSLAHHKVSQKQNQVSNEMNNQILSMKYLNETNTQKIRRQTQALETELNARIPKDEFEEMEKGGRLDSQTEKKAENWANPVVILERKMDRQRDRNLEKTRLTERFVRNAKIIEKSFDTIRVNSGMSSIDEIVTTYLKAEEQNYELAHYYNLLDTESDDLKVKNMQLDAEIKRYKALRVANKLSLSVAVAGKRKELEDLQDELNEGNNHVKAAIDDYAEVQQYMDLMMDKFKKGEYKTLLSSNEMPYDENTVLKETNITGYLNSLEEQINQLITEVASKNKDPNVMSSTLNFSEMGVKSF
jgi:hypothetical protein